MSHPRAWATFLALLAFAAPQSAFGQSVTTGSVSGRVQDADGRGLGSVRIELRPVDGGLAVVAESGPGGVFLFPLLEPGAYELLAERLGYLPTLVRPLPVQADRGLDVAVTLTVASAVVLAPDTAAFPGRGLASGSRPGQDRAFSGWELGLPHRRGELGDLLRLSSVAGGTQVEGLPIALGAVAVEGLPFKAAGHSDAGPLETLLFPLRASGEAALLAGRPDVEWAGAAGGVISTLATSEARGTGGEIGGLYSGESFITGPTDLPGYTSWRGGGSVNAFLVGDSAHVRVFGEAMRDETPVRLGNIRAGDVEAFEAAGLGVGSLAGRTPGFTTRQNAGGSFDWRFGGNGRVSVLALYGQGEQSWALADYTGVDLPVAIDGRDLFTAATAAGALSEQVAVQVRVGYGQSHREYLPAGVATGFGDAAVAFVPANVQLGGDPAYPATFDRSALSAQSTVHIWNGGHHVKLGAGLQLTSHDRAHIPEGEGIYLFGSPSAYVARSGVFQGTEGARPSATFSVAEFFGYGQDTWEIAPGLDITTGLRYEQETLPDGELVRNQRWSELTGLDNTNVPGSVSDLTLVAGFDWNVRERHDWRIRGDVAIQLGDVAPALLAEAITHDGRVSSTAAVGDVESPITLGPRLTILSPSLEAPLTTRASFGISRALGSTTALHFDGVLRQTDNLPSRVDLNLASAAPFEDQYGRPIYGRLERVGPLLYPEPGSNRRFGEFDAVSAVTSAASSTYWGVTVALEKHVGLLKASGSYTYSATRDDWLAAPDAAPLHGLSPFPGGEVAVDWTDGISDFDTPHRFTMATELTLPFARMITLGAFGRLESGRPFTPGFGRAIDANGDGVAGNDPAFVDGAIEGVDALQREWDCLRTGVGQFVERNSCRLPQRQLVDAWLGIRIPGLGPVTPELRIEALGAVSEGFDSYDTALFRLDPDGTLATDETTGVVNVPLEVNPGFGTALTPARELSRFRISLRMVF